MDRYEKLPNNLYGAELITGAITPNHTHNAEIFFIINSTSDSETAEREALQIITHFGKTKYHFFGSHSALWQRVFRDTAARIFPTESEKVIIINYENTDSFAEELKASINQKYFVPTDFYLIYDDSELYKQVTEILK